VKGHENLRFNDEPDTIALIAVLLENAGHTVSSNTAGAVGYIAKPLDAATFAKEVERLAG
tara:strand:- start:122 stop:301 length:180 start_codon:yes stop_codon:yes gene_type:complete